MAEPFLPQVIVNTDFLQASTASVQQTAACIVGPHAQTVRYGQAGEKPLGSIGDYISANTVAYPWPNRQPGGIVDLASVRLFADDAKLVFFTENQGTGSTVAPVAGVPNQIRISGSDGFAKQGSHNRLAGLYGRDVKLGDRVRVSGVNSSIRYTIDTYVTGLTGPNDAAVVGSASVDSSNHVTQGAFTSSTQTAGVSNCLSPNINATDYSGLADGVLSEIYTLTVLEGSVAQDITTAVLQLRSASGLDDVLTFSPTTVGNTATVGNRGLKLGFNQSGGSGCDLQQGQVWQLTVMQSFTATSVTAGGSYLGAEDDTYILTVTRGGFLADADPNKRPQWTVTTVKGLDAGGPTTIDTAGLAVAIGTKTATATVAGGTTALCKGDRFYIPVTAAKPGLVNTLVLANSLPSQLLSLADLTILLYKQTDVEIPHNREGFDPLTNFSVAPSGITVASDISLHDPEFVDNSGNPIALSLLEGALYVEYRAWLADLAGRVYSVSDIGLLPDAVSGAIDPANPLKYGLSKALIGNAGTPTQYIAVADPSSADSWAFAIKQLVGRTDVYNIVPLTYDPSILSLFHAHVSTQSQPTSGNERAMVIGLKPVTSRQVIGPESSTNHGIVLAVVAPDPDAVGTPVTILSVPADNARFLTNGVRPGDTVRFGYSTSFGDSTYQTAVVDRVISETTIKLTAAWPAVVSVPQRLEIWHTNSDAEIKDDLKAQAAAYSDRRVCAVWSDLIGIDVMRVETYYMAAAVAGLVSGVLQHQGLTNVAVDGFADVVSAVGRFNRDEIADLSGNGVWVISRTPSVQSNAVITRLATTTDPNSIEDREEMVRRNVDVLTRFIRDGLVGYLGTSNVTPSMQSTLRVELDARHSAAMTSNSTARLGAPLIDAVTNSIAQDPVFHDQYNISATWTIPAPLNKIVYNATIIV